MVYAFPNIYIHLKQLFNLVVKYRHVPYNSIQGLIVPINKDRLKDAKDMLIILDR